MANSSVIQIKLETKGIKDGLEQIKVKQRDTFKSWQNSSTALVAKLNEIEAVEKRLGRAKISAADSKTAGDKVGFAKANADVKLYTASLKRLKIEEKELARIRNIEGKKETVYKQDAARSERQIKLLQKEEKALESKSHAEKKATTEMKNRLLVYSRAEQIERKYKQLIEEVRTARKRGILTTKEAVVAEKRLNKEMRLSVMDAKNSSMGYKNLTNNIVRHIRQIESLIVAMYLLKRGYDATFGRGHEYNKLIERETIGLKLLIAQNLQNVDVMGKMVSAQEKFNFAQTKAVEVMKIVRKINIDTPHNLLETFQIYKLLVPQVLRYGGTLKDVGTITKNVSIVASSMGIEFQQLLKTVDSLMSGEMKESGLKRAMEQFGISNTELKKHLNEGGDIVQLFIDKLKNADIAGKEISVSWDGVVSKFLNVWDAMFGELQKPMFLGMEDQIASLAKYLNKNSKEIVKDVKGIGTIIVKVSDDLLAVASAWVLWKYAAPMLKTLSGRINIVTVSLGRQKAMALANGSALVAMGNSAKVAGAKIMALGGVIKSFMASNWVMIALMASFEAYNLLVGEAEESHDRLAKAINITSDNMKKLGIEQSKVLLIDQKKAISELLKKQHDLTVEVKRTEFQRKQGYQILGGILGLNDEELQIAKAQLEKINEKLTKMREGEKLIRDRIEDEKVSVGINYKIANATDAIAKSLEKASKKATDFKNTMQDALNGYYSALRANQVQMGTMSSFEAKFADIEDKKTKNLQEQQKIMKEMQNISDQTVLAPAKKEGQKLITKAMETQSKRYLKNAEERLKIETETQSIINIESKKNLDLDLKVYSNQQDLVAERIKGNEKLKETARLTAGINKAQRALDNARQKARLIGATEQDKANVASKLLALEKARNAQRKAGEKSSEKSSNYADKTAKAMMGVTEELKKQELLKNKIIELEGGGILSSPGEKVKWSKKEWENQKKIVAEQKVLIKGAKSKERFTKSETKELEKHIKYLEAMNKLTNKFESIFSSLFKGDFASAINLTLSDTIEKTMASTSKLVSNIGGDLMGSIAGGFVGGAIGFGLNLLTESLFGDKKEIAPELTDAMQKSSESTVNALNDILNVQYPMLELTRSMTGYLETIASGFGGIESSLFREGFDLGGSLYKEYSSSGFLFGGTQTSLYGTSITIDPASIDELISGQTKAYATTVDEIVKTTWYGRTTTKYKSTDMDISSIIAQDLAVATKALFEGITEMGSALGLGTTGLRGMTIDIGEFETTGMTPEEITQGIQERFSADADAIAEALLAPMEAYRVGSEGLFETANRVVINMDQITHSLDLLEMGLSDINEPIYALTEAMVAGAGGIEALTTGFTTYRENFFTEQEQFDMMFKNMSISFKTLGLGLPGTNDEFRDLAESLDRNTIEGATLFGELMTLADGFVEMSSASEDLKDSISSYVNDINDLMMGQYSYFNMVQKAEFASRYVDIAKQSNGLLSVTDALRQDMEAAFNTTTTVEEYIPFVDRLVSSLKKEEKEATMDDIVDKIDEAIGAIKMGSGATTRASYQDKLSTGTYKGQSA